MTTLMNLYGEEERRITGVLFISSHSFLKKHTYVYIITGYFNTFIEY